MAGKYSLDLCVILSGCSHLAKLHLVSYTPNLHHHLAIGCTTTWHCHMGLHFIFFFLFFFVVA